MTDQYKELLEQIVQAWDHPVSVGEKEFLRLMRKARKLLGTEK